jgi:hypothetical protein
MIRTRSVVAAAVVAASLAAAAPAGAADPVSYCPADPVTSFPDGSFIYSNQAGDAGCVTARVFPNGAARLDSVVVAPGWTYSVKSNGGTTNKSRVEVQFTQTATRNRVDVRMEAGKTVIK